MAYRNGHQLLTLSASPEFILYSVSLSYSHITIQTPSTSHTTPLPHPLLHHLTFSHHSIRLSTSYVASASHILPQHIACCLIASHTGSATHKIHQHPVSWQHCVSQQLMSPPKTLFTSPLLTPLRFPNFPISSRRPMERSTTVLDGVEPYSTTNLYPAFLNELSVTLLGITFRHMPPFSLTAWHSTHSVPPKTTNYVNTLQHQELLAI